MCEGHEWDAYAGEMRATCSTIMSHEKYRSRLLNMFKKAEKEAVAEARVELPLAQLSRYLCLGTTQMCDNSDLSVRTNATHNSACTTCLRIANVLQFRRRQIGRASFGKHDFDTANDEAVDGMCDRLDLHLRLRDLPETRRYCEDMRDDFEDELLELVTRHKGQASVHDWATMVCVDAVGACTAKQIDPEIRQTHVEQ